MLVIVVPREFVVVFVVVFFVVLVVVGVLVSVLVGGWEGLVVGLVWVVANKELHIGPVVGWL